MYMSKTSIHQYPKNKLTHLIESPNWGSGIGGPGPDQSINQSIDPTFVFFQLDSS